jgi:hypothetical protein
MTKDRTMQPYIGFSVQSSLIEILTEGLQPRAQLQPQHQQQRSREELTAIIRDVLDVLDDDDMVDGASSSS